MQATFDIDALASIPKPAELRRQLSIRLRETDVLRRLIKVAERAAELQASEASGSQPETSTPA